jgi:hypothetical protein
MIRLQLMYARHTDSYLHICFRKIRGAAASSDIQVVSSVAGGICKLDGGLLFALRGIKLYGLGKWTNKTNM